ncbi:succinate dehydrogenase cytochrome b subunit [Mucilaginibacter flavidus]|uniref:succinate dehydrogenase cytochrome b subunit n=1 Tax=Mucilaginibacter flavidus TaxID=2949309 RepID=UPI00209269FC|nr:succinate dehydrogenase cytochrome b subunit [Mucilaginibacter flavidus]MCO5948580.1 succinate dehydrogenase cytochrome b subunit [Mucilaginibacter flavidus]
MTWKQLLTSSLGKKYLMGATGFFLIIYLIVHASVNALIFYDDNGATFNVVAHFMLHNYFIRFLEIGLFAVFILHIVQGLMLWKQNTSARKINYYRQNFPREIKWYSRYMGWLGTFILLFLVLHLYNFWAGTKHELYFKGPSNDLYKEMKKVFTSPLLFTLYMLGLVSLLFHLLQGFQSAFQTFGINNRRWIPIVRRIGIFYSIIICIVFALMPIAFMAGWLQ